MPELPEVETTRRGIEPLLRSQQVSGVVVRQPALRWEIPGRLAAELPGQTIHAISRRGKYLLLEMDSGHLIIHLGMSGSLRVLEQPPPAGKHDHFDLVTAGGLTLRLNDPRRFGAVLWTSDKPDRHCLICHLGPEPLECDDLGEHLYRRSRNKRQSVKGFIMDGRQVVGVGNIYACEALFQAGINPARAAARISRKRYEILASAIKEILLIAIDSGGTTLKDFTQSDGQPGYFSRSLQVYGRNNRPCKRCGAEILSKVICQRNSYYCKTCQT